MKSPLPITKGELEGVIVEDTLGLIGIDGSTLPSGQAEGALILVNLGALTNCQQSRRQSQCHRRESEHGGFRSCPRLVLDTFLS